MDTNIIAESMHKLDRRSIASELLHVGSKWLSHFALLEGLPWTPAPIRPDCTQFCHSDSERGGLWPCTVTRGSGLSEMVDFGTCKSAAVGVLEKVIHTHTHTHTHTCICIQHTQLVNSSVEFTHWKPCYTGSYRTTDGQIQSHSLTHQRHKNRNVKGTLVVHPCQTEYPHC